MLIFICNKATALKQQEGVLCLLFE